MAHFRNHKPFMSNSKKIEMENDNADRLGQIRPEYIANALLREAATNAREAGTDIRTALISKVGLPIWMVDIASVMDYSTLAAWRWALDKGYLTSYGRGVSLAEVECMMKVKRYITEEIMLRPSEGETKDYQYQSSVETAVVRKANRPQKSNNPRLSKEKGCEDAPEYDGGDTTGLFDTKRQKQLWVMPTELCQWVPDEETGEMGPGKRVLLIQDLKDIYKANQKFLTTCREADIQISKELKNADPGIPIHLINREIREWIREWKPTVRETYQRPDKERRNDIEFYKRRAIKELREAVKLAQAENGYSGDLWKLAFEYLGRYARVQIPGYTLEERIEAQIRRKYNNKTYRVEGIAYLPPMAAGEILEPMLREKAERLITKNPELKDGWPWVIKVYFDAEAREDFDGQEVVACGVGLKMAGLEESSEESEIDDDFEENED